MIAKWSGIAVVFLGLTAVFTISGSFLRNPLLQRTFWHVFTHPTKAFTDHGLDLTGYYNLNDHFSPDKRKSLTVLLLGIDHDYGGKRINGMAVPVTLRNMPGRSDAIMIARFEFDGDAVSSINILSIPRDARVRVPDHGIHKINAAYAYGGPDLSMATIRDVFGISPDYYVDVNFEGFQQVVDAIGGVDVDVHQKLDYDDYWGNLHVHLKPGKQHLNGYKAMGYVRIRHTDDDLARAQRQHEFLEALRSRVVSPDAFMKLPNAVSAITDNLKTSLTEDQMLTLANLARRAPKDAITLETLPVIEGRKYVYINRRKSVALIRKLFFKDKQLVEKLEVNTPDAEVIPIRHKRRRVRDHGSGWGSHAASATVDPALDKSNNSNVREPSSPSSTTDSTGSSLERSGKGESEGGSGTADLPKSDGSSGGEGSKSPTKGKDSGDSTSSRDQLSVISG